MRPLRPVLLLLATVALLPACQKPPQAKLEPPRPVRTVVAQAQAIGAVLTLPGEVRPRIETRYGFRVGGKIAERYVSVGDRVKPGQILARLDPQDAAPAVASAQASLEAQRTEAKLAAAELARQRNLMEKNFISQASLDRQQATYDAAVSRVQAAEAQLRQARNAVEFQTLAADAAGHVVAVEAEAGQVVSAGQPVVRVAKAGEVEVLVNVPEKDVATARSAGRWQVQVPAIGERPLQGRLRELSPVSDPASRTYPMRLTLQGDLAGVELGMTAIVTAASGSGSALVLPMAALYSKDERPHVWVVDPASQSVRPVAVKTAGLVGDAVIVVAGVKAGERVVTAGANLLVAGQKVKVLEGAATDAAGAAGAGASEPAAAAANGPGTGAAR